MENNGFKSDQKGIWFQPEAQGENIPAPIWVCAPLNIVAITRDHNNENHGRRLLFFDSDNIKHELSIPMELLAGDGSELRKILLSLGLVIGPSRKARELLNMYLSISTPTVKIRCIDRVGWFENKYILPKETLSLSTDEKVIFQSTNLSIDCYTSSGTLEEWQKNVSFYCGDNSRLAFSVSTAFASVLLSLMNEESGGIHLVGQSSCGKTTALKVAGSVFGGKKMINTWRATSNGLEAIAALHNDSLLILDEMGQMDPKEVGETAYLLANNLGKSRANKNGFARKKQEWCLLFLSSGEVTLSEHMRQAGKRAKAGQEVRIVNIPANTGEFGIFERLWEAESGADFSRRLSKNAQTYYGIAGKEFITKILNDLTNATDCIKTLQTKFYNENLPPNADGQVIRVLHRFALIAAAGTLATEWKITNWFEKEAFWAASECFKAWIKARGGTSSQEEKSSLLQVRHFFALHGESRFSTWSEEVGKTFNRAGYRRFVDDILNYYVFPDVFRTDICEGFDPNMVSKTLIQNQWLMPDSEGKSTRGENLPCSSNTIRCYRFNGEKIFSDAI